MNKNLIALTVGSAMLAGCVTINIYFPAAATEKAADKIIDEVMQTPKSDQPPSPAAAPVDNTKPKETK
jgi:hypothetical protein